MERYNDEYGFLLGWLLLQPQRHEWISSIIPQPVFSASSCINEVRPENDDWFKDDRLEFLQEHQLVLDGNIIFLDTADSALEMNERWYGGLFKPVALALQKPAAARLDETLRHYLTNSNTGNHDFKYGSLTAQVFTGQELLLGHEVLGFDWGWHSYLCSGLETCLVEQFGGEWNGLGLIANGSIASRFADYINEHNLGEPGLYLSYALLGLI